MQKCLKTTVLKSGDPEDGLCLVLLLCHQHDCLHTGLTVEMNKATPQSQMLCKQRLFDGDRDAPGLEDSAN